jgi:hypothetical protein
MCCVRYGVVNVSHRSKDDRVAAVNNGMIANKRLIDQQQLRSINIVCTFTVPTSDGYVDKIVARYMDTDKAKKLRYMPYASHGIGRTFFNDYTVPQ